MGTARAVSGIGKTPIGLFLLGILIGGGITGLVVYFYPKGTTNQNPPTLNLNFPLHQLYNATPPPTITRPPTTVKITLQVMEHVVQIAGDTSSTPIFYHAWTFNGTVPGPIIRVRVNDTVQFTLLNNANSTQGHSVDFHAIQGPPSVYYQTAPPGGQFKVNFTVLKPGVYMYHCGTAPVPMHLTNGMYGMIIVDPAGGLPPAKEFALVQSEFYIKLGSDGVYTEDMDKAANGSPDYQAFNGFANQYTGANALQAKVGEEIRIFLVNVGPNGFSAFHNIGAIFDKVYEEGSLTSTPLQDVQTATVAPGGAGIFELTYKQAGNYPIVSHAIWSLTKGLLAMVSVSDPSTSSLTTNTIPAPFSPMTDVSAKTEDSQPLE